MTDSGDINPFYMTDLDFWDCFGKQPRLITEDYGKHFPSKTTPDMYVSLWPFRFNVGDCLIKQFKTVDPSYKTERCF